MNSVLGVNNKPQKAEQTASSIPTGNHKIDLSIGDNNAESILSGIAYFLLIVGILCSIFIGSYVGKESKAEDGWRVFGLLLFGSVITWAVSMLLINISNNLRTIKHLLAKEKGLE